MLKKQEEEEEDSGSADEGVGIGIGIDCLHLCCGAHFIAFALLIRGAVQVFAEGTSSRVCHEAMRRLTSRSASASPSLSAQILTRSATESTAAHSL